ncbi:hypothetical protein BDZ89DRAFT_1132381 [Hymenopellis radicata]|nr:hypothetical protein BDZ89DRAFT_1132381 [Hymenopellis radicata]
MATSSSSLSTSLPSPSTASSSPPTIRPLSPAHYPELPISSLKDPCASAIQETARQALLSRYGAECVHRHQWTWTTSASVKKPDRWVPTYSLAPLKNISLEDVYTEFSNGLKGHLSIRELRAKWGAEWQGASNAEKTDASRRKRFFELVEALKARHKNWQDKHVFEFLNSRFCIDAKSSSKHLRSLRLFLEWIPNKKEDGFDKVLQESNLFTF